MPQPLVVAARLLVLLLVRLTAAVTDHPDTVNIDQCFTVYDLISDPAVRAAVYLAAGAAAPQQSVCLRGWANLCTQDVNLTATVSGGEPVALAFGDGTHLQTLTNDTGFITLPDELFPGSVCDESQVRLRDTIIAAGGLRGCLDLHLSCWPDAIYLPCLDLGDDTDACTATDRCSCTQHPECGWCDADARCTRMHTRA